MTESTTRSVDQILDGADAFFQGTDALHRTVRRVSERLDAEGIDYAVVGGLALNLHDYVREEYSRLWNAVNHARDQSE